MLGGVFICYRREDTAGFARLIYDRLTNKLGRDSVFFDVDNIPPGLDFVEILSERVGKCDALIAVIGKTWAASVDVRDRRRLDDPTDFVRIEIEAALERNIRVIPVLVDGAPMPRRDDLPDGMKKLTRRQGIEISHSRFDSDVDRLTRALSALDEEIRLREAADRFAREREARAAAEAETAEQAKRLAEAEARRAEEERRAHDAAEAERATREERDRREAAEAADKAGQARRLAEAEAQLADEKWRAREAAKAECAANEEQQKREGGGAKEQGPFPAEADAPDAAKPEAAIVRAEGEAVSAGPEPFFGAAPIWRLARLLQPSGGGSKFALVATAVGVVILLAAILVSQLAPKQGIATTGEPTANIATKPAEESTLTTPQSQYATGSYYEYLGEGGFIVNGQATDWAANYGRAAYWYRKAADEGNADAQLKLGWLYENGFGVEKDYGQAKICYQKAADQGNEDARAALKRLGGGNTPPVSTTESTPNEPTTAQGQYQIGNNYFYGQGGTNQDYRQAMYWYRKAADQGDPDAQYILGRLFEEGLGVQRDHGQAKFWYQKAADQGHVGAKADLVRLKDGKTPSTSVTPVTAGSLAPLTGAETTSNAPTTPQAQYEMGNNYHYGNQGVNIDSRQAIYWYEKAADQGYADAQYMLGWLYEDGWGVTKDFAQARAWYQKAADQGNAGAQTCLKRLDAGATPTASTTAATPPTSTTPTMPLGQFEKGNDYYYGRGGVKQDYQLATYWYQKAAAQGYADAQYALGRSYESGLGIEKDYSQARAWYQKATDQRNTDAQAGLSRLGSAASVKISSASCSRIDDGVFKIEMSGEVTAPDESFFTAIATPYRPTPRSTFKLSCEAWGDGGVGRNNYFCQHSVNQPSQTKWTMTQILIDQAGTVPHMVTGTLRKGRPAPMPPILASDVYNNLDCR